MSAEIIQLRDFQNPKDLARMYSEESLIPQAIAIIGGLEVFAGDHSQAGAFHAPDKDSA